MTAATPTSLVLGPAEQAALRAAAEAAYPQECCGLLVGRRHSGQAEITLFVTRVVPGDNLHAEPTRSFELDPAIHLAVLRQLREAAGNPDSDQVLGHYHSHPDAPAVPSERDRAQINDPDLLWIIIGVIHGKADAPTAWQASASPPSFHPVPVRSAGQDAAESEMP